MNRFKDLRVWQESSDLVIQIYSLTKNFPIDEKFGMISQINRAVVSISSNIAEGAGRGSNKEFLQFLNIAIGSSFELESQLLISQKLNFLSANGLENDVSNINRIQNMLFKLQKSIKEKVIVT